jgi:AhpD family alkylhydroperoxidase
MEDRQMARKETVKEIKNTLGLVPKWMDQMPEGGLDGFWSMAKNFWLADTAVPNKYKELIGLAISGVTRCRYCALFHTEAARLYGATEEEISEANMMAGISMAGSTFINGQQIDYDQFKQETHSIMEYVRSHAAAA